MDEILAQFADHEITQLLWRSKQQAMFAAGCTGQSDRFLI
jgi:hypothetical protein